MRVGFNTYDPLGAARAPQRLDRLPPVATNVDRQAHPVEVRKKMKVIFDFQAEVSRQMYIQLEFCASREREIGLHCSQERIKSIWQHHQPFAPTSIRKNSSRASTRRA
jgi:hypothetical protein